MSSSIELLSLHELNIRRDNLIKLLKNTNCEIEKRQKILKEFISKEKLLDAENLDAENLDAENLDAENLDAENLDTIDNQQMTPRKLVSDINPINLEESVDSTSTCKKLPKKQIKIKINILKPNK